MLLRGVAAGILHDGMAGLILFGCCVDDVFVGDYVGLLFGGLVEGLAFKVAVRGSDVKGL